MMVYLVIRKEDNLILGGFKTWGDAFNYKNNSPLLAIKEIAII